MGTGALFASKIIGIKMLVDAHEDTLIAFKCLTQFGFGNPGKGSIECFVFADAAAGHEPAGLGWWIFPPAQQHATLTIFYDQINGNQRSMRDDLRKDMIG